MFSCKSRYACGGKTGPYSDSDEDSSYGFKATTGGKTRAAALTSGGGGGGGDFDGDEDYHIYGNVTFGYKPILKTRLSSAASSSSVRRRNGAAAVKRTVSFSGVESPPSPDARRRRSLHRPPPPCYSVAVRRAASFSATRRSAAAEMVAQRRQRLPLPHEQAPLAEPPQSLAEPPPPFRDADHATSPPPPRCPASHAVVVVDVHRCAAASDGGNGAEISEQQTAEVPAPTSAGLDKSPTKPVGNGTLTAPNATDIAGQRMDSYRFSMANLEDSQDVDLDAVLGELSALESQYQSTSSLIDAEKIDNNSINRMLSNSNQPGTVVRTDSPDNDSAFSDCVSLLSSSESSASSGTTNHSGNKVRESSKAEKIRLALQKMKEASVKKLFIKVFNDDGGAKSLLVDEGMRCSYVMRLLADKHHINLGPRWGLVEHLPDLHMERVYEEHELLVDNLMLWTRDSKNRLLFVERPERTLIFENPSLFNTNQQTLSHVTSNFAQEYFCNGGLPGVEGPLYIKTDSRKGWKKYHSVLRASGLYYYKDKASRTPRDLVCLATFDVNQVYYGVGWKKKHKAPTEHGFAIKHPCLQQPKSTKYIKYVCAEDEQTLHRWMSAIRVVKYGRQMLDNYETALAGGDGTAGGGCPDAAPASLRGGGGDAGAADLTMLMEDIESGLSSDSSSSSGCDVAFESDYPPCGTIKRKPPKLPLTATTRQLACSVDSPAAAVAASSAAAAAAAAAAASSSSAVQPKPVKTVKFADHHHYVHHQHEQLHHHHPHHHHPYPHHHRTPSLESLPPPPPELLVDDEDEPNDQDIMNVVPPPPPKLLSPPSTAFLADLHRVVRKKWQVSQKCKLDTMATPHEVLGFRDPVHEPYDQNGGTYSREANVSNWVAEHYGPNNLYENIYPAHQPSAARSSPPPPPPPGHVSAAGGLAHAGANNNNNNNCAMLKKRPPPPPPPRSEKTQLTTVVL